MSPSRLTCKFLVWENFEQAQSNVRIEMGDKIKDEMETLNFDSASFLRILMETKKEINPEGSVNVV